MALILPRSVMVAVAQQAPDGSRTSDMGYLLGVAGIGIVINSIPVGILVRVENMSELCRREPPIHLGGYSLIIPTVVVLLILIYTILITTKTANNLKQLQPKHFKNLPSNNALTYVDTQLVCFFLIIYFILGLLIIFLRMIDILSKENFILYGNLFQLCMNSLVISLIFPVYVILKTRRYLPRLWSEEAPIILQNNDFYAVRLSQVSPQQVDLN